MELNEPFEVTEEIWLTRPYLTCWHYKAIEKQPQPPPLDPATWKRLQQQVGPVAKRMWNYYPAYFGLFCFVPGLAILYALRLAGLAPIWRLAIYFCSVIGLEKLLSCLFRSQNERIAQEIRQAIENEESIELLGPDKLRVRWGASSYQSVYCLVKDGVVPRRHPERGAIVAEGWVFLFGAGLVFISLRQILWNVDV